MKVIVLDSSYFTTIDGLRSIAKGVSDSIKVPKMMPNTEFTEAFAGANSAFGGLTNSAIVSNFTINLLLSGSMSFLWGLLHTTQILAHFPLINIMMP